MEKVWNKTVPIIVVTFGTLVETVNLAFRIQSIKQVSLLLDLFPFFDCSNQTCF